MVPSVKNELLLISEVLLPFFAPSRLKQPKKEEFL